MTPKEIKDLRDWMGLDNRGLGKEIGVDQYTVEKYMRGISVPPERVVKRLLKLKNLMVPPWEALDIRLRNGLSREALGEKIGKSGRTVGAYERGARRVPGEVSIILRGLPGNNTVVRNLRRRAGLSREEFGGMIGKSGRTVGAYERGEIEPPADVFMKLKTLKAMLDVNATYID